MQICSTERRLLLTMPALYLLLQVSIVLHHHHADSYYNDKDSLHLTPAGFLASHIKLDVLTHLPSNSLLPPPPSVIILSTDNLGEPITVLTIAPSQSRAPPSKLLV